ncbi:MAG: hypothetical protein ABI644_06420 [Arenimonas sp.]
MPRWLWITLVLSISLLCWLGLRSPEPSRTAPISTDGTSACPMPDKFRRDDQPLQSNIDGRIRPVMLGESTIIPLAGFSLQARVLSRENYYMGTEAEFSPTDLALGWGPMSEPDMAKKLNVSQSGRWYRYSWGSEGPPIEQSEIISNSANMHMVPANNSVAASLKDISANDVIELDGWLIRIEKNDGWRWQSSLSRNDSGDGACEVVYVCSIRVKR